MSFERGKQRDVTESAARVDKAAVLRSAALGAGSFAVTYVLTFLVWTQMELPESNSVQDLLLRGAVALIRANVPDWMVTGMLVYNVHYVDLFYDGRLIAGYVNVFDFAGGGLITLVHLVPPLLLFGAGFLAARTTGLAGTASTAATSGALVFAGYLLLVLISAPLFAYSAGPASLSVPVVNAVIIAGLVYPVVFGALGGLTASLVEQSV
ncbi:transporter [Haloarchaeobius sp. DFWS5]|uniref:transporter n=1 Tax=Haloarchaeobius sp. DFWS5 TaxID=3446114 RepID=UPI003EB81D34